VIIKSYEVEKINLNKDGIVLFYGKNNGLKNEAIEILNKNKSNILS
jgi:DNA polymerase-3 subunit delta